MNLSRLRRRAAWGIWLENLARAAGPAGFILAAYLAAALFGFGAPWLFLAVLALAAVSLLMGLAKLRLPAPREIDRRIEQVSGLRHQPIAMLEDMPENESEMASALWRIHQRRATAALKHARAGRPALAAAQHDPFALRGLLLLLLLTGWVIAGPAAPPRLAAAFSLPAWPFAGPGVNAWITPPGYSGAPPLLLAAGEHPVVLAGSRLAVVIDAAGRPHGALDGEAIHFIGTAQDGFRADAVLRRSGRLRIGAWWRPLEAWNLTVVMPEKPQVEMHQPVISGNQMRISWRVQDRYGLVSLGATLMPVGHPRAHPETLGIPLDSPDLKQAGGIARLDIGDTPYAGLEVSVTLSARNMAGLSGEAGPMRLLLPPQAFADRTAAALAALRQRLALDPERSPAVGASLQALAAAPPSHISAGSDLQMAFLARQMQSAEISADAALKRLSALAQEVEEGPDYQPAQALAAANQALEQALREAITTGKRLDPSRLQSLLVAMHAALAQHLQALGQRLAADAALRASLDTADLDRLAEQIARDQAAGQSGKAKAELNRLEQILAALQSAKPMTAAQARRAQIADQAAQDISRMAQGESALLDQTNKGSGRAGAQARLQRQLSLTRQNLSNAGLSLPGLGDAANAMAMAHEALTQQQVGTAATAEGGAIESLQKAAAALAASQAMRFGETPSPGMEQYEYGQGLDGAPDEDSLPGILPTGDNGAGAIQRQIIRNDDNPALPSAVHQYYHRLLDQDEDQP